MHIIIIRTAGHHIPVGQSKGFAVVCHIIMVSKSEHVSKLMNKCSYTRWNFAARAAIPNLITASISIYFHSVEGEAHSPVILERCRVGPYQVFIVWCIILSTSSIEEIDVVHTSVAIKIIIAEVNFGIQPHACIPHGFAHAHINISSLVASIVIILMRQSNGTFHHKFRCEEPIAAVAEIVTRTTVCSIAVCESLLVEHVGIEGQWVFHRLKSEVAELNEYH